MVFGGSLHPRLHELEDKLDHRRPQDPDPDVQYGPVHAISLAPGGLLAEILAREETMVNSLHNQGIDRLAPGLAVEATAPDGIIEAVRIEGAEGFALGVQWHPEYKAPANPDSVKLYSAFNAAVLARKRRKIAA